MRGSGAATRRPPARTRGPGSNHVSCERQHCRRGLVQRAQARWRGQWARPGGAASVTPPWLTERGRGRSAPDRRPRCAGPSGQGPTVAWSGPWQCRWDPARGDRTATSPEVRRRRESAESNRGGSAGRAQRARHAERSVRRQRDHHRSTSLIPAPIETTARTLGAMSAYPSGRGRLESGRWPGNPARVRGVTSLSESHPESGAPIRWQALREADPWARGPSGTARPARQGPPRSPGASPRRRRR